MDQAVHFDKTIALPALVSKNGRLVFVNQDLAAACSRRNSGGTS
jgi:hypothetical protein